MTILIDLVDYLLTIMDASEAYALTLFRDFEQEFVAAMTAYLSILMFNEPSLVYEISMEKDSLKSHTVSFTPRSEQVSRTCKNL